MVAAPPQPPSRASLTALRPYPENAATWPAAGRVVLAAWDGDEVVVYQAFRREIAEHALAHQRFVVPGEPSPFSLSRTSWIKPNFLWMMYRSGWARKEGQEHVLAVHLARPFFDAVLAGVVPSGAPAGETQAEWRRRLAASDVVMQWDPDHGPHGEKLARRAIQLGLRGPTLERYASEAVTRIVDATPLARAGHAALAAGAEPETPSERPYPVAPEIAARLGLSPSRAGVPG